MPKILVHKQNLKLCWLSYASLESLKDRNLQRGAEIHGFVGSGWHSQPLLKPCDRLGSLVCPFPALGRLTQPRE